MMEPGLDMVGCCNELNAGYAADGYSRGAGIGCVVVTHMVGGLSVLNAIAGETAIDSDDNANADDIRSLRLLLWALSWVSTCPAFFCDTASHHACRCIRGASPCHLCHRHPGESTLLCAGTAAALPITPIESLDWSIG